jgi:hypothetical protein
MQKRMFHGSISILEGEVDHTHDFGKPDSPRHGRQRRVDYVRGESGWPKYMVSRRCARLLCALQCSRP